jgi:hypothetical protein
LIQVCSCNQYMSLSEDISGNIRFSNGLYNWLKYLLVAMPLLFFVRKILKITCWSVEFVLEIFSSNILIRVLWVKWRKNILIISTPIAKCLSKILSKLWTNEVHIPNILHKLLLIYDQSSWNKDKVTNLAMKVKAQPGGKLKWY